MNVNVLNASVMYLLVAQSNVNSLLWTLHTVYIRAILQCLLLPRYYQELYPLIIYHHLHVCILLHGSIRGDIDVGHSWECGASGDDAEADWFLC